MQNILIFMLVLATVLTGCSNAPQVPLPSLIHRIDVEQGNVVTQDMVNQLRPGMDKRQVAFIMGTPLVSDSFHTNRWDYIYEMHPGDGSDKKRYRIALHFQNELLQGLDGDFRPMQDTGDSTRVAESAAIDVPLQERQDKGFIMQFWDKITSGDDEDIPGADTQKKSEGKTK